MGYCSTGVEEWKSGVLEYSNTLILQYSIYEKRGENVAKIVSYIIILLAGLVILLGSALGVFLAPLFQADEMLAQIRIEEVVDASSDLQYISSQYQ